MTQSSPSANRPSSRRPRSSAEPPTAVLIDGSALFLTVRAYPELRSLEYRALVDLLVREIPGLMRPGPGAAPWVMWTSASPQNESQGRFLDFAEAQLMWEVRPTPPSESFIVEPHQVGLGSENRAGMNRLIRFDAAIAFAIGRLASTHRVVVVSDSFALAEPLLRVATISTGTPGREPWLAFFGTALDARWQRLLYKDTARRVNFLDLDDFDVELFGLSGSRASSSRPSHTDGIVF